MSAVFSFEEEIVSKVFSTGWSEETHTTGLNKNSMYSSTVQNFS